MRNDGHDHSRFASSLALPSIDHEANGPISALVKLTAWLGRLLGGRADKTHRVG